MQRIFLLKGKLQSYSWGGYDYIPELLNFVNDSAKPYAEYWMGAHPSQPSTVNINNEEVSLAGLIELHGEEVLGKAVYKTFETLPYLFKILDVRQMLSIQVHPSKGEAKLGFENEEKRNIPITAPHRNYKDQNHKPELMVALSDFWLLHGFKPLELLRQTLTSVPEMNYLKPVLEKGGYAELFSFVMQMAQQDVDKTISILSDRIMPLYDQKKLDRNSEDYWAARAIATFCKVPPYDRGIFCIYLFNLLFLKKGEGIFQPAGLPHAYLQGQNAEIMANSDNVLRAGLTDKHIDVAELLKHTVCGPTVPRVLQGSDRTESSYPAPAKEFALRRYKLGLNEVKFSTDSAEVLFVMEGEVQLSTGTEQVHIKKGESAFIIADSSVALHSHTEAAVFRASAGAV